MQDQDNKFPVNLRIELPEEAKELLHAVHSMELVEVKITDQAMYDTAAEQMKKVKGFAKSIEERRKELTKPLDESKKEIMAFFNPALETCQKAEGLIKRGILEYSEEIERKRRIAQAAAEETARKEREKLIAQAEKAAEKGKEEKAQALEEVATTVVAAPVHEAVQAVKGVSFRETYSCAIDSLPDLIIAVAAKHIMKKSGGDVATMQQMIMDGMMNQVPDNALTPDMKFLNNQAKAMKDNFNYAGCRAEKERSVSSRSS